MEAISEKATLIKNYGLLAKEPRLRHDNQIQSLHSSLAIEANSLSLDEAQALVNGHPVQGPQKDIDDVLDALQAYRLIEQIDPYQMADFLKVHGLLTQHTVKETGRWRSGGEGVYAGGSCIFMAPPPELVPSLMERLFRWLKANRKNVHPLIASSVFHFEMVFIHPFADGNGRLARYWQSALLGEWNPLFYYLPFENQIKDHQKDYYDAIALSENHGDSTAFVTFMLRMIDEALASLLKESQHLLLEEDPYVVALLKIMRKGESYSLRQLMDALHLSSRSSFLKNYLSKALAKGLVSLLYPESPHNPRQRYYRPN